MKELLYKCKDGTKLFKIPGHKSEKDFIVLTEFPKNPHAHSIEYIGACLKAKAEIEDINYPKTVDGIKTGNQGRDFLFDFMRWCVYRVELPIREICKKFKLPGF